MKTEKSNRERLTATLAESARCRRACEAVNVDVRNGLLIVGSASQKDDQRSLPARSNVGLDGTTIGHPEETGLGIGEAAASS